MLAALNCSTSADLFNIVSGLPGGVEAIQPLHPPHSKGDDLRPRSTGHLASDLPIFRERPRGQSHRLEKSNGNKGNPQEFEGPEEVQEAWIDKDVDYYRYK